MDWYPLWNSLRIALEHGRGAVGLQIGQKLPGSLGVGGGLQHGGRVDHLTAHLPGGLIHGGQACAVGIGAVHDTGIHAGFGDLGGDLLDVGAVPPACCAARP